MDPLSVRVSEHNQSFLKQMSDLGKTKTEIVNNALDLLRKVQLQNELTAMAKDNPEEDALLAEEGMEDYVTLLDDAA
ncbi:MAG: hypothetical protein ACD_28C00290G0001 [uncultured bacterium]|nr:MAG: hypothetical protein ACD_28C00290G0001 [uncultured bacterium]